MKLSKKRIFAMLLVVCLMLSAIPAFAATVTIEVADLNVPEEGLANVVSRAGGQASQIKFVLTQAASKALGVDIANTPDGYFIGTTLDVTMTYAGSGEVLCPTFTVKGLPITGSTKTNANDAICLLAANASLIDYSEELLALRAEGKADNEILNAAAIRFDEYTYSNSTMYRGEWVKNDIEIDTGSFPEGTVFLPAYNFTFNTGEWPWSHDGRWEPYSYFQALGSDGKTKLETEGPVNLFVAKETGDYDVWVLCAGANGRADQDVALAFNGRAMKTNISKATTKTGLPFWLWVKMDAETLHLNQGERMTVQLTKDSDMYGRMAAIALVPTSAEYAPADNTQPQLSVADFITLQSCTTLPYVIETKPNVSVTVDGKEVSVFPRRAITKNYPVRFLDASYNVITYATVADALVEAGVIEKTEISNGALTTKSVLVNKKPAFDLDYMPVSAGDDIELVTPDKTNFAPVGGDNRLVGNGGFGGGDGLAAAGISGYTYKIVTNGNAVKNFTWPVDITQTDALAGCYVNGYAKVKVDMTEENYSNYSNGLATDGDDTLVTVFVKDWLIEHSAIQASSGRLELAITDPSKGKYRTAEVDGVKYHTPEYMYGGSMQAGLYDLSNLYITNSESKAETKVTANKTGEGKYELMSNKAVPVCLMRVVYGENNAITSVSMENTVLSFSSKDAKTVMVGENEKVFVWEGSFLGNSTANIKPLCAPLTK